MNISLRLLMGMATLAILVLAVTMISEDQVSSRASAPDLSEGLANPVASRIGPLPDPGPSTTVSSSTTTNQTASEPTGSTSPDELSSTTPSDHEHESPQPSAETATTASGATGGTITGKVCPCTVTGTATLKGDIQLAGDLIVDGGTLVARSGVNVDGNGFQIMFMNGGAADFQGSKTSTWSGDGSNANLTRDINFTNLRRIMFHEGASKSTLRYFTVSNSGGPDLGDYPIHFHLNGNSTRGTLVEGVVVANGRHHAFVPHGSYGITFKDTIAKNIQCDAYWWDPPEFQSSSTVNNSNDILFDHALADGVTNCPGDTRGHRLSAFRLGSGSRNVVRNSVARSVAASSPRDCSGFHWPELHASQPSSWGFTDNASYGSKCNGIFVWQNDNEDHIVRGFAGDGIDHGAYVNRFDYRNVNVDFIEVHALGWSVTGGSADVVTAFKHRLEGNPVNLKNVSIGRFIVDNAKDEGTVPGTYRLDGVGLKCGDIEWRSVVDGTKVIVDGIEC